MSEQGAYRIRDWGEHFENAKSRTIKECLWVPMPNKQDGMGFTRIMVEPDGAAIYGVWCMIVGACSRQHKGRRSGWLTDDGHHEGTAWVPRDLAMRWRRPVEEIERALVFLSSDPVGWLDAPTTRTPDDTTVPRDDTTGYSDILEGRNEGRKEGNGTPPPDGLFGQALSAVADAEKNPDLSGSVPIHIQEIWDEYIAVVLEPLGRSAILSQPRVDLINRTQGEVGKGSTLMAIRGHVLNGKLMGRTGGEPKVNIEDVLAKWNLTPSIERAREALQKEGNLQDAEKWIREWAAGDRLDFDAVPPGPIRNAINRIGEPGVEGMHDTSGLGGVLSILLSELNQARGAN